MYTFGTYIKKKREALSKNDRSFSQRQLCKRIGIEPSYLSKIEREVPVSLSEEKILLLAKELDVAPDYLLALGGKISSDVQEIIKSRPELFSKLVREMKNMPDEAIGSEAEFKNIMVALNNLHDLASIGAFRFSNKAEKSFWTDQIPSILEINDNTPPSLEAALSPLPQVEQDRVRTAAANAKKNEEALHLELSFESKEGTKKHIAVWGYFEKDPITGEDIRLGIIQDITERTQLKNEMASAKEALRLQVDEQTKTITSAIEELKSEIQRREQLEKDLRTLNDQTAQKAELQNQYFKEHAFQVRTLASHIAAEDQATSSSTPEIKATLSRIILKINDLGDFLNLEKGLSSDVADFNIHACIDSIIAALNEDISKAGIDINYSQAPQLPEVISGDKARVEQIINSLLELMIHQTQWGSFQFSARCDTSEKPHLHFSFYTPSSRSVVTKRHFFPSATEDKSLHLSNPVRIIGPQIEQLDGTLTVSQPSGSELSIQIRIPVYTPTRQPTADQTSSLQAPDHGNPILIVEDDPFNRLYLEKGLQGEGYEVVATTNGEDAIDEIKQHRFEAALLDIQLPDINGTKVAQFIRQKKDHSNSSIPIVAVTAHATPEDRNRFKQSGINEVVSKPFDIKELIQTLRNLLSANPTTSNPK